MLTTIMPFTTSGELMLMLGMALLAGALVWVLAPATVRLCCRMGLVAPVTERSSHSCPTPHGGGILLPLVVTPLGIGLTWLWPLPFKGYLTVLMMGGMLVAYVSWLDDRHELSPKVRLMVHLFAVAITLVLLPQLFDFMPIFVEKALILLGWAWFVNLYNFMDGADGLATGEAIALSLGISGIVPAFAPLGLVIAAACTGFLRVNRPPAKIFMGDVGATWLGYTLAGLFLLAAVDDTFNVIWPLATLPLVFAADATTTLLRRMLQGHKPWEPHKTFWFHRYMALGHGHGSLMGRVAMLNTVLFGLAFASYAHGVPLAGFLCGLLVICAGAWYIRAHEAAQRSGR